MSADENKALVRRFLEAMDEGNLDAMKELMAPDFIDHSVLPGEGSDREGYLQGVATEDATFTITNFTIEDMIAEGDKVAVRGAISGTHQGDLMGIPPTGKQVRVALIDVNRIESGKLVERWGISDMLGMMQQLGVVPPPEEGES